mmetsp:Transcript_17866/g.46049  ORF Transcript_17866/g.46049 Transcript_17866/m.46049 type:complete len:205 (-) Transcript_17866:33-647(-)
MLRLQRVPVEVAEQHQKAGGDRARDLAEFPHPPPKEEHAGDDVGQEDDAEDDHEVEQVRARRVDRLGENGEPRLGCEGLQACARDQEHEHAEVHAEESEEVANDRHLLMERHNQVKGWRFKDIPNLLVPWKVVCVVALTTIFMMEYYLRNCVWSHGRWISKDMYLPVSTEDFGFWHAFFPNLFRVDTETDPFWTRAGVGLEVES